MAIGVPCHAGWTAWWPRSMQRRPLSGYRHTATSLRHWRLDAGPPRPRRGAPCLKAPCGVKQAHVPAQSLLPCHAIPSTTSTVEDHSHTDSPTLTGLESCAQAFRGPNSILGGTQMHTKWATTGQPAKSSAPLPRRQLVRTGAAPPRGPGSTTPITLRGPGTGLGHPPPAKSSAPLQCCQLAKGRAHWNRAPLARTYPGTSKAPAPSTTPSSCPGPPSRPRRQRPTPGSSSQLAKGLGRREPAHAHL